ncbi:MAG: hypothetical protein AB1813_03315 [Verrucomicrobiota bacterium]
MSRFGIPALPWFTPFFCATTISIGSALPESDERANKVADLNTPRVFPTLSSRADWQRRAAQIREQILVSCGLWPMPEKTPLAAKIFGRIERDGYSIEKVHLQTWPGFYLAGNLYRPIGKGPGPFPAVLNPHGHWSNGRMADNADGSIAARCIHFARNGMIAFSYDMVGYNDTTQVNHGFGRQPTNQLWSISLMGLQTWNSIRALDFIATLPEADPKRLACTGESGGGTQTFILGAIDDRLAVQAPIVMVSHSMQGGCLCENAPGLRVDYSNMEIAAVPAPRPQILVAATGDWTKATMTIEGPAIESVYKLFNAQDRFRYLIYDFGHNYNRTTREAVYGWFGKWLGNAAHADPVAESAYIKEPDSELRVFPDGQRPQDAMNEQDLIRSLVERAKDQLRAIEPTDSKSFDRFKKLMMPAWQRTLQVEIPERGLQVQVGERRTLSGYIHTPITLGRSGRRDRIPAVMISPSRDRHRLLIVLVHPEGKSAFLDANGVLKGLAKVLVDRGETILLLDTFLTGELANATAAQARKYFANYFTTYNRTDLQERVQDLITACAFGQFHSKGRRVVLCGLERAGLWALLAAPVVDATIADVSALDSESDEVLLAQDLFIPGLRRVGGFAGAALLGAPNPILVHNSANKFSTDALARTYHALDRDDRMRIASGQLSDAEIAEWIGKLPKD